MIDHVINLFKYFPEVNNSIVAGLLIFTRILGFAFFAPILSRKETPSLIKISFSFMLTIVFVGILHPSAPPKEMSLILEVFLNTVFGALVGYVAAVIFETIPAAGDMINMQMGLSSAMMFDPSAKTQISVMGRFFTFLGIIIFFQIGGLYWLISAFEKSFHIFPLYATSIPLQQVVNLDYIILLTGNVLFIGLQLAAPILLATLGMDIILGIISKTAPQVNVFQLSFLFKPLLGAWIMIIILPMLVNVISDYFSYYSSIY